MFAIQPLAIIKSVVLAFISGLFLGTAAGLGLGLFGAFFVDENGDSLLLTIVVFSMGAAPAAICGFLASYFAQDRTLVHSSVSGVVYLAILTSFLLWPDADPISWTDALHYLIAIPLALLGGWLYLSQSDS